MIRSEIAVIITAYNAEETILRAVTSALNQEVELPIRVIVIDDGSTDGTVAALNTVADQRLEVTKAGRLGRAKALNLALSKAAPAEFVANLDADDVMLPGRLQSQVSYLHSNTAVAVVGGAWIEAHLNEAEVLTSLFEVRPPTSPDDLEREFVKAFPLCHSTITYRRLNAVKLDGFDPQRSARIDFDLWVRILADGGHIANVEVPVAIHFKHQGTYFDRKFSPVKSAKQMLRLNLMANHALKGGLLGGATALARYGYSLTRRHSVKGRPRFSTSLPLESLSSDGSKVDLG